MSSGTISVVWRGPLPSAIEPTTENTTMYVECFVRPHPDGTKRIYVNSYKWQNNVAPTGGFVVEIPLKTGIRDAKKIVRADARRRGLLE